MSTESFNEEETALLNRGLNFVPTPPKIDHVSTIADIETSIKYLNIFDKENIRRAAKPIIKNAINIKSPINNFNTNSIIKNLRSKDVIYTKADKGNALVILNKSDYLNRMKETVTSTSFTKIPKNPLPKMIKQASQISTDMSTILKIPKYRLSVPNPIVPRLYGLPKIHKPGNKMRPIVSSIDAPPYKIAKEVVAELRMLPPPPGLFVKNTYDFVDRLKDIILQEDEILVSFDVESLYPNVPIPEALQILNNWLGSCDIPDEKADILFRATKFCMEQNEFQFNNEFFKQTFGANMGNPLSCFVANTFIGNIETELNQNNKLPKTWLRYVDDIFTILKPDEIEPLLSILNNIYPTIKFTVEKETNKALPFLDLLLVRKASTIEIEIYRKPTNTARYTTIDSHGPRTTKMAALNSMVYRMCRLPLQIPAYMKELKHLKEIACINGFREQDIDFLTKKHSKRLKRNSLTSFYLQKKSQPKRVLFNFVPQLTNFLEPIFKKHNIQIVYNNNNKLKNQLGSAKDKINNNDASGIYKVSCGDCEKVYIGQTKRSIGKRFKEHISHIKYNRPNRSAIALHCDETHHFNIITENLNLVKRINKPNQLDAYECIYMQKYKNILMNTDSGPIQSSLFNFIKN